MAQQAYDGLISYSRDRRIFVIVSSFSFFTLFTATPHQSQRADENMMIDTTLLVHFFGKKGKAELTFDDFYRYDNLSWKKL